MRVRLPEGSRPAAARRSSATSSSSRARPRSGCSARTTRRRRRRRGRTRRPRSASRPTAAPETRPTRGPWRSQTQIDLDLFDITRNVIGPLTFSFSFYKIMPQLPVAGLNHGEQPTIQRGPINAAAPPTAPAAAGQLDPRGVLQRREPVPGRQVQRRPRHHASPSTTSVCTRSSQAIRHRCASRTWSPSRRSRSSRTAPTR